MTSAHGSRANSTVIIAYRGEKRNTGLRKRLGKPGKVRKLRNCIGTISQRKEKVEDISWYAELTEGM